MKLTNELREALAAKVWKHAFEKRGRENTRDLAVFGIKVLRSSIGPKDSKLIDGLPYGICPTVSSIGFKLGGDFHRIQLGDKFRIPAYLNDKTCVLVNDDETDPLVVEWRELKSRDDALKAEIKATMAEVKEVLYSCSTRKQLLTTWPEIKALVGSLLDDPEKPVRALTVGNLNEKVGLSV